MQVNEAAQRAAAMRQVVPTKLKEIYAEKLGQLRPSIDALRQSSDKGAEGAGTEGSCKQQGQENVGEDRDSPSSYSPTPQRIKEKLANSGNKLPALRCDKCICAQGKGGHTRVRRLTPHVMEAAS